MAAWWDKLGRWLLLTHPTAVERYWELDACRGVAILLMVTYHLVFDLAFFGYYDIPVTSGLWRLYGRTSAILLLLLVGVALTIGYERSAIRQGRPPPYRAYLGRGAKLLGWGIVITLLSWTYLGRPVILFGILHLIGAAVMLAYPFLRLGKTNAIVGLTFLLAGVWVNGIPVTQPWLLWLGLRPHLFHQLDWFPLLPWFGLVLMGVAGGAYLYPTGKRRFDLPAWNSQPGINQLAWLGRHSLLIYLAHQPALMGVLVLVAFLR